MVSGALLLLALGVAPGTQAHIYWDNGGSIGRAYLDGTGVDRSFITGRTGEGVAIDTAHVYWTNFLDGTVGRANLDGTGVDENFITGLTVSVLGPTAIAVDGAHIYWSNLATSTIGRANLDGTSVDENFITGTRPGELAVDSAHLYWAPGATGAVGRANLDGHFVNQRFIGTSDFGGVSGGAVDDAHVYWINARSGTMGRANLDGTGVDENFISGIASHVASPARVVVDGAHLYWINATFNPPTIGRANLDGTSVNQRFIEGGITGTAVALAVSPLETTITAGPTGTVGSDTASFSFSGSEPGGFRCRLDGGGWSICNPPASYAGLANGAHSFEVRAADGAGNVDPTPASRSWTVGTSGGANTTTLAFGASTLVQVALAGGRIPRGGPLSVRVTNSNGFVVTGSLSGETDKPVAARKRLVKLKASAFVIGAHASKTLKLKLPKALRQLLSRKRKLALRLTATLKDPGGHSRTVKQRVTPRLK